MMIRNVGSKVPMGLITRIPGTRDLNFTSNKFSTSMRRIYESGQLYSGIFHFESLYMKNCPNLKENFDEILKSYDGCYKNKNDIEKNEKQLTVDLKNFRDDMILDDLIKHKGMDHIVKYFPEYRFEYIYDDPFSVICLKSLHEAVINIPGAKKWIIELEHQNNTSNHPMMSKIKENPLVDEMGHTMNTWLWTVNVIKKVYQLGWNEFVKSILTIRKIGTS